MPLAKETSAASAYVTTAIRIPTDALSAVRRIAIDRAEQHGGRVSVSGVLMELALERRAAGQCILPTPKDARGSFS
jgi:hypothetical protein